MKKIIAIIIFILLSMTSIISHASLSDVYIQKGQKNQNILITIQKANGNIIWTGQSSKYKVEVNGQSTILDLSSDKSIKETMAKFFPDQIFIKFLFFNVAPNSDVYIEGRKYATIDNKGNFTNGNFYDTVPKTHHIKLMKNNKIISETKIDIDDQYDVMCTGIITLKCQPQHNNNQ